MTTEIPFVGPHPPRPPLLTHTFTHWGASSYTSVIKHQPGPHVITSECLSTWVEYKDFYTELSWVHYRDVWSTQLKKLDMVLMFFITNLSTICFSRPHWPSTLIKYLDTCHSVVLTCTLPIVWSQLNSWQTLNSTNVKKMTVGQQSTIYTLSSLLSPGDSSRST